MQKRETAGLNQPLRDPFCVSMAFAPASLFDPVALLIVLAGTACASVARAGARDTALALRQSLALARIGLDHDANRTALARWAHAIRERGVLGAEGPTPPDADLARALNALLRTGSLPALHGAHEQARARQMRERNRATGVFEQAGELAPVFGLVGTLFSITQLAPGGGVEAVSVTLGAIATAVLSSLYGVLAAHLVFLPLANAIARRSQAEDEAREAMIEWFARDIADALPGATGPRLASVRTVA